MSIERILSELTAEFEAAGDPDPSLSVIDYDEQNFGDAIIRYSGTFGTLRVTRDRGVYLLDVLSDGGEQPIERVVPAVTPLVAAQRPLREILVAWRTAAAH